MKEAVCRYCGGNIKYVATTAPPDQYFITGEVQEYKGKYLNGYTCPARHPKREYDSTKGHEPLTKEDKVLKILRTYENTIRLTNKH